MTDEEKKKYETFKYYYQTNTEKGISYIPDYMCENVLNLIEKQAQEIEELKENKGYHLGFIDGGISKRYEMEDKIKAKVIEIKDRPIKDEFITATQGKLNIIIEIESLLEKE